MSTIVYGCTIFIGILGVILLDRYAMNHLREMEENYYQKKLKKLENMNNLLR